MFHHSHWSKINDEMYRNAMMGKLLSYRIRKAVSADIYLHNRYIYIDELVPEQTANTLANHDALRIPSFVMLHLLFVLNHHRMGNTVRARRHVKSLQSLLLQDSDVRVQSNLRDISWQILGICQQICGDFEGAFNSYQRSFAEESICFIRVSTITRALIILFQMKQANSDTLR